MVAPGTCPLCTRLCRALIRSSTRLVIARAHHVTPSTPGARHSSSSMRQNSPRNKLTVHMMHNKAVNCSCFLFPPARKTPAHRRSIPWTPVPPGCGSAVCWISRVFPWAFAASSTASAKVSFLVSYCFTGTTLSSDSPHCVQVRRAAFAPLRTVLLRIPVWARLESPGSRAHVVSLFFSTCQGLRPPSSRFGHDVIASQPDVAFH